MFGHPLGKLVEFGLELAPIKRNPMTQLVRKYPSHSLCRVLVIAKFGMDWNQLKGFVVWIAMLWKGGQRLQMNNKGFLLQRRARSTVAAQRGEDCLSIASA